MRSNPCRFHAGSSRISGSLIKRTGLSSLAIVSLLMFPVFGWSQTVSEPESTSPPLDHSAVIAELQQLLLEHYVFPELAKEISKYLAKQLASGRYSPASDLQSFADALTEDLRSTSGDKHLMVWPTPPRSPSDETNLGTAMSEARGKKSNYGFRRVEILPGNIGLIKLSSFSLDQLYEDAIPTLDAAMAMVANARTLIFDVRGNPGGSPRIARRLASYLFPAEPVHLNDFYFRSSDTVLSYWTEQDLPGTLLPDLPVYILVDKDTFSAAEGFAYNLKHLGRALVVGQTTGGGSHGGSTRPLGPHLQAYIPYSRSIHPVTKTDFEEVGVIPQLETEPDQALCEALHHHKGVTDQMLDGNRQPCQQTTKGTGY